MQAYHYNTLRFYDGTMQCQVDPLQSKIAGKDVYLIPADCTLTKPTLKDGYTPRWDGKAWEQYANDKTVYGYTNNDDGTINYYGSAHTEEELTARVKEIDLLFADTEPVSVDGVYWLSADDPAYTEAKKAHDKAEAIAELDAQYDADKTDIMNYYTQALFAGDEEEQEQLKAEMDEIDAQYIEDRKALEEAD